MPSKRPKQKTAKSSLSLQLQAVRSRVTEKRRSFKVTEDTTVTDPAFRVLSHAAVRDALSAIRIRSEKIDPKALFLQEKSDPEAFQDLVGRLRELLGEQAEIVGDKLIWPEIEHATRLRAAEVTIDRADPLPHRVDSARKSKYSILRVDPNRRELVLEEVSGDVPSGRGSKETPVEDEPI